MVLCERREEIGHCHFLLAGFKVQLVAQRRVLCDCDDRRFTGIAVLPLDALFTFLAGVSFFALRSLRTGIAAHALWSPGTHRPYRAAWADRTGTALLAPEAARPHGPLLTAWIFGPLRACGSLNGHVGAACVRLTAAVPAAISGLVVHGYLPLMKVADRQFIICVEREKRVSGIRRRCVHGKGEVKRRRRSP